MGFDLLTKTFSHEINALRPVIDYSKELTDGVTMVQPYFQAIYKFNNQFSIIPGIHYSYFDLNSSSALEPRISVSWQRTEKQKISLGYGLHSRNQALSTYFLGTRMKDGSLVETNRNLEFSKSHQMVFSLDQSLSENTRLKAEAYYQALNKVPVESNKSSFSMLNSGASWGVNTEDSLVNKGTGKNYGVEFTLERFFSRNFYYLSTISLFESKYTGSDNVERNTAFNGNYVFNFLVGKEIPVKKNSTINLDFKVTWAGGKRYTPVDLAASRAANTTKYDDTRAFSQQFDPFLKADFKIGYRINARRISQEWMFYIENFTDHNNVLMQLYSRSTNQVRNVNQLGFFPMMQYRLRF
jgi:hypothetical protein